MPGASGIELCRALRADERFTQTPVIFLTAHRDPDIVQRIFEAGADDYVTKHGQPLSLALLDVDRFKQLNDRYGHLLGDAVLRRLGGLMVASFRSEDVVARWGGEEFAIGMYGMSRENGVRRIGELLEDFSSVGVSDGRSGVAGVTFTAGVAEYGLDGDDLQALYRSADEALLAGKAEGRRRVVAAGRVPIPAYEPAT